MRTKNLLKLALTMVAMLTITGAWAQGENQGSTTWTAQTTLNDYVQEGTGGTNLVTVNKFMPFWVWPSAAYNPDFNFADVTAYATGAAISAEVNSSFTYYFYSDAGYSTALTVTTDYETQSQSKNYVEVQFVGTPAANTLYDVTRYIGVTETPPAAGITCEGTEVNATVRVIDQPMMRFPAASLSTVMGLTNVAHYGCSGSTEVSNTATAISVALDNTIDAIGADLFNRYHVTMNYNVYNYDVNGADGTLTNPVAVGSPTLNINNLTADATNAPTAANPVVATSTTLIPGKTYGLEGTKATVYEYTLTGWNSGISRKSDYIAIRALENATPGSSAWDDYSYYTRNIDADVRLTARVIVLPAPVTGPIYHISNSWAN
jgi:hypothetical protein